MTCFLGSSAEEVWVSAAGAQAVARPLCVECLEKIRAAHANYPVLLLWIPSSPETQTTSLPVCWMIAFQERADRCREQLMFSSAIGWILFMWYHSALESSSTESFDIKMPQIITFTIYCNSETSSLLFVCSIPIWIFLCAAQTAHFPDKVRSSSV